MRTPERAIGRLDILGAAERDTILRVWNDTARRAASACWPAATGLAATLPALFAAQAARTPEAIALVFEERALSYAELEAHANRLAHHLQRLGVGPEVVVGAVRGALAGDGGRPARHPQGRRRLSAARSGLPGERLAFMLADAGRAWC